MAKKILVTPKSFVASKEIGEAIFKNYDVEIVWNTTGKTLNEEQMLELCADVDGVLVGVDPMPAAVLRNAKNLKAISKYGSGLDNIDLDVAKELQIEVTRRIGRQFRRCGRTGHCADVCHFPAIYTRQSKT